jgi:hypothetical protein
MPGYTVASLTYGLLGLQVKFLPLIAKGVVKNKDFRGTQPRQYLPDLAA